jgi:hypothetical protein
MGARGSDSDSGNHGSNPGPPARESASNRCVFVVSSLAGIVPKLPRVRHLREVAAGRQGNELNAVDENARLKIAQRRNYDLKFYS